MCDCIREIDEHLEKYNTKLGAAIGIRDRQLVLFGVYIETYKIETKRRGRPKAIVASYCPFCGEKYQNAAPDIAE